MPQLITDFIKAGKERILFVLLGNILLGFGVAVFKLAGLGNDPFDGMNMALADFFGMYYPLLQVLVNMGFFVIQIIWGRRLIGFGTIVNAFGLGYIVAFWIQVLGSFMSTPSLLILQLIMVVIGVLFCSLGLSMYQQADMGVAPYDAFSIIMNEKIRKLPYFWARMITDAGCALVCFLAGGLVGLGTIISAFCLGPVIHFFDLHVSKPILGRK